MILSILIGIKPIFSEQPTHLPTNKMFSLVQRLTYQEKAVRKSTGAPILLHNFVLEIVADKAGRGQPVLNEVAYLSYELGGEIVREKINFTKSKELSLTIYDAKSIARKDPELADHLKGPLFPERHKGYLKFTFIKPELDHTKRIFIEYELFEDIISKTPIPQKIIYEEYDSPPHTSPNKTPCLAS